MVHSGISLSARASTVTQEWWAIGVGNRVRQNCTLYSQCGDCGSAAGRDCVSAAGFGHHTDAMSQRKVRKSQGKGSGPLATEASEGSSVRYRTLDPVRSSAETIPLLENPNSLEQVDKVRAPSVFEESSKYISLIMPSYNEEARLPAVLDETLRYLQNRARKDNSFTYEILVIDDGSKDNTVKVALEYSKKHGLDVVRVIKQGANFGKGAAVRLGMLCSRGELLLMLDADGATQITDLEKLEGQIKKEHAELYPPESTTASAKLQDVPIVVFGSRAHLEKQALASRKWYRNVLMKGFHICVLLVAGSGVRDTQCGFKLFTRSVARVIFINLRLRRWCFDVEIVYLCKQLHITVKEVAVNWTEIPGSKVKVWSIIHMLFELLLIRLLYGFHIWTIQKAMF